MGYCTPDELIATFNEQRLAELSDDSGSFPDDTVIQGAIDFASGRIDSYLVGRYVVPVPSPSPVLGVLKNHCIVLALFRLFQDRLLAESYKSFVDDVNNAIEWLKAVAEGKMDLPLAPTNAVNLPGTEQDPLFTGSEPAIYILDPAGKGPIFL